MFLQEQELSQILAVVGMSTSQEEQIFIVSYNLSASREVIEEKQFHEPNLQQGDLEFDHPCHFVEETKESWTTFDGE